MSLRSHRVVALVTHTSTSGTAFFKRSRVGMKRSQALVLVLCCLVLVTAVVLAFLGAVATETQSSKFFANGTSVKLLDDSTVNLVMGQIKDATHGLDSGGNTLAWASQPGMIRTYDTSGNASSYYKLYSWDGMVGSGAFNPSLSTEVPLATWTNSPAIYTDLNEPVYNSTLASFVYPIVDPGATNCVQGFSLTSAPVSSRNAAPMPVKWLYVLQNGTISVAEGTGTIANVNGATANNPIVGRIAFWTDDDTCKININTAAGDAWVNESSPPSQWSAGNPGSFWDTPRTCSSFETNLAVAQAVQNEFQRYPGHPATTYLSAVFTNMTSSQIYSIAPRVNGGGSMGGTVAFSATTGAITPDSDRLYASVDELLFTTNLVSSTRTANNIPLAPNAATLRQTIEQAKFFLTAHSRAPEVNLFNQPRVVTWPISSTADSNHRTAFDSLIAYCGTLSTNAANPNSYYFQRSDPTSPTADLPSTGATTGLGRNRELITYLRNLTSLPIPGFGTTTFLSKYPLDRDEILTEIFDYIRALNEDDTSVGGTFVPFTKDLGFTATSNGHGLGQIVPIQDSSPSSGATPLRGFGRFPTITEASLIFIGAGQTDAAGANTSVIPGSTPATIANGKTRVQAAFALKFFDPSYGYVRENPNFQIKVTGLNNFQWSDGATTQSMGFAASAQSTLTGERLTDFFAGSAAYPFNSGFSSSTFDFPTAGTISFNSGNSTANQTVTITIYGPADVNQTTPLQTFSIIFPSGNFPVPLLAPNVVSGTTKDFRQLTTSGKGRFIPGSTGIFATWICSRDVVRSIVANTDPRVIMGLADVPSSMFSPILNYNSPTVFEAHSLYDGSGQVPPNPLYGALLGTLVPNVSAWAIPTPSNPSNNTNSFYNFTFTGPPVDGVQPTVTSSSADKGSGTGGGWGGHTVEGVHTLSGGYVQPSYGVYAGTNGPTGTIPGDWDTGPGDVDDEPWINKSDEGNVPSITTTIPYYGLNWAASGTTFFSPNRQMPSPGMFGSLPTGVMSNRPWQTLLFRPDPDGQKTHIGAQSPQDLLLLDLFMMPVVEPYAISDPFSTAGKINMNYQIVPFTYMTRDTGIRAVLRSEQILALPLSDDLTYKNTAIHNITPSRRYYLNLDETTGTLAGFTARFSANDLFRCAAEICNIWLVPSGTTPALTYVGMQSFWNPSPVPTTGTANGMLTGDNVRERPYTNIYPRLTTNSNTYTIHLRVQILKKVLGTPAGQWVEGSDVVAGEYRGSSTIERYLDTTEAIPDYAAASTAASLASLPPMDDYYKIRVVETKQFVP